MCDVYRMVMNAENTLDQIHKPIKRSVCSQSLLCTKQIQHVVNIQH